MKILLLLISSIVAVNCLDSNTTEISRGARIVLGDEAYPGQFPHMAYLEINGTGFCGGSIIDQNWVLTAAHCTYYIKSLKVTVGVTDRSKPQEQEPWRLTFDIVVNTSNVIAYPTYNAVTYENDVSLIRLPKTLIFNEYINKINLPDPSFINSNFVDFEGVVAGWGVTFLTETSSKLNYVYLKVKTNEYCGQQIGTNFNGTSHLCCQSAKFPYLGNTCFGDSGGGLVIEINGLRFLIAIVSYGKTLLAIVDCKIIGFALLSPTAFTRITTFLQWILDIISNSQSTSLTTI